MSAWKYAAKDLIDVYVKEGPIVFESSLLKRWSTINGIYGHLYDTNKRDERFHDWLGETHLKDTLKDVIITSYERCTETPIFFKTRKAKVTEEDDYLLTDCIKAATAAPSVWPYHQMRNGLYMDALYAKNPSMFGVFEALHYHHVQHDDILLISLGTGFIKEHIDPKNVLTSGIGFYKDAFNSTINANTKCFMHMVKGQVKTLDVDIPLPESHMGITDVSKEHFNYMIKATHDYLAAHDQELIEFAKMLLPESEWIKPAEPVPSAESAEPVPSAESAEPVPSAESAESVPSAESAESVPSLETSSIRSEEEKDDHDTTNT